jgi:hypothetical protein
LKAQSQIKISLFGMALQHPWWLRIHVFYKKVIFYLLSFFRTYSGYAGSKGLLRRALPGHKDRGTGWEVVSVACCVGAMSR